MFTQRIVFVCLLLAGIGAFFVFKKPTSLQDTITLGTMSGWPPFVSLTNTGTYEGFDITVAQEIVRRLGKKLVIQDMDTAALITALEQGKVDFIMTGLDITTERLQKIAMIPYQGDPITELPLLFWKEIPKGITSLSDLRTIPGSVVCVESGSSQEGILRQYQGFETRLSEPLNSILELRYGKALAVLLERKLFNTLKKKFPELVALSIPLDDKNKMLGCGIGVKKTNATLLMQIEAIIADLKKNGFLEKEEKRWFNQANTQEGA